ncbi:hypothetical protein HHX47_DHR5000668 [Lentinula edodes]|nr:hypothetical protein HHX47_DHR5000668 [Lentinula edodes]
MVLLFLLLLVALLAKADGDVACTGTGLNWYINMVGESPYQVGTMNVNTPPDACDEQVADCCCNSVAFTLSMLCLKFVYSLLIAMSNYIHATLVANKEEAAMELTQVKVPTSSTCRVLVRLDNGAAPSRTRVFQITSILQCVIAT